MDFKKILARSFWASLFDWVALKIGPILAGLVAGYRIGKNEVAKKEAEISKLNLDLGKKENAEAVEKLFRDKSDLDHVRDAINDGGRKS